MAVSRGFRIGALALLGVLAVGLGIVLLSSDSDHADAAPGQRTPARQLLLTPADLPGGFRYFSPDFDGQPNPDVHCAAIHPADTTTAIDEWIAAFAPRGCNALFYRYRGHTAETFRLVPPLIGTGALDAGSVEAAETGLELAGLLLRSGSTRKSAPPSQPPPALARKPSSSASGAASYESSPAAVRRPQRSPGAPATHLASSWSAACPRLRPTIAGHSPSRNASSRRSARAT